MEQTKISFWLDSSQRPFPELILTPRYNKTTITAFSQETLSIERQEIRWVQRLDSFQKALRQLEKAVQLVSTEIIAGDGLTLMQDGLIQRYEFTVELAWKLMKDYAQYEGITDRLGGPRDTIRHALQIGLISDDHWMGMIEDRNQRKHLHPSSRYGEHSFLSAGLHRQEQYR